MNWVLILDSDSDIVSITFTSLDNLNQSSVYKTFVSSEYDNLYEYENKIVETMNFHVSLRDSVYVVYNFENQELYKMFCKRFRFLSNRIVERIDLHTLRVINNCKSLSR
jgi:hypothetical protein